MLLFSQSAYFNDLLDSFAVGVVMVNTKGRVYAVNKAATKILGLPRRLLTEAGAFEAILARVDRPGRLRRFLSGAIRKTQAPPPLHLRYDHPDGRPASLVLSASILVEYDKVFGIMLQISDVSELVALHEREKHMLEITNQAQRERIESLSLLSRAVAHQIRNPLMSIGGFANRLLRRHPQDDPDHEALSMILDGAKRLEAIVAAVGDHARPRSPAPVPCSLQGLAVTARAMAERRVEVMPARLTLAVPDLRLSTDPELLTAALAAALRNALEAAAETPGGHVALTAATENAWLILTVEDNGPGIPPETLPFCFDPLFSTKTVGVGMGLATARRDMRLLGGDMFLENLPQGGARATLKLPCLTTPAAPDPAATHDAIAPRHP